MRFDDRLSTVLGLTTEAPRDRAVQWRQLVELVARGGGGTDPALLARALGRIAVLRLEIPDAVRASAARAIAGPSVPVGLLAIFAADRPEIVAPLLGAVELDQAGWAEVRAGASPEVRALVDSVSPPPEQAAPPAVRAAAQIREPASSGAVGIFRWECSSAGEVDWVEGVPRAAVVGLSIGDKLRRPFAAHLPFQDEPVTAAEAGVVAGEWLWSGLPQFEPRSGRFAGYAGTARREGAGPAPASPPAATGLLAPAMDSAALRELIHELRTPLTAIIGFGEIIEGQFLGPAHRAYRSRAGEIVRQARRLLGAVDELDLAAKLGSAKDKAYTHTPVTTLMTALETRLAEPDRARGVSLRVEVRNGADRVAMEQGLAERLLRRFVEGVIDAAGNGETIELVADRFGPHVALSTKRPRAIADLTESELLDSNLNLREGTTLGLGFTLRLVRGLARIAGGGLEVASGRLILLLPAASPSNA